MFLKGVIRNNKQTKCQTIILFNVHYKSESSGNKFALKKFQNINHQQRQYISMSQKEIYILQNAIVLSQKFLKRVSVNRINNFCFHSRFSEIRFYFV